MIAEIEFHTGVADKLGFACRLLRKAYRKGSRVSVTGPSADLTALDRQLWIFEERDFVPHLRTSGAPNAALAARTPIWLLDIDNGVPPAGAPDVLVNLGAEPPADLSAFSRVIEIVSAEPDDEAAGRQRWRGYKARGIEIKHYKTGD